MDPDNALTLARMFLAAAFVAGLLPIWRAWRMRRPVERVDFEATEGPFEKHI